MKRVALILLVVFFVLQYSLWIGDGSLPAAWRLQQAIESQQRDNFEARERNMALEAEVEDLKQGLAAIEERARAELGMIRKDETFFHVVEE